MKLISTAKSHSLLLLLLLLAIPTFSRMIRFGTFTQHDFHIFRLYEFNKCIKDLVFPCRWAPDSGLGYGEPIFNFYPQVSYWIGEPFVLAGLSVLNSNKISFAVSLVASAITMYILALSLWKNKFSALVSALLYTYAPYRAVDVWVRGALPESTAFIFYPLIIYFFDQFINSKKAMFLSLFSLSFAALFLTHNLSFLMFLLFFAPYSIFRLYKSSPRFFVQFFIAGLLIFGLSSFQLLPVIFEMKYITLGKTLEGYYDYHAHFVSLKQLLWDRSWGYGASVWGDGDNLNLSIGHLHWLLPLASLVLAWNNKNRKQFLTIALISAIGIFSLFLIHSRSTFIWETIPGLARLQFPWRFLSIAVFALSLAGGYVASLGKKRILIVALIVTGVIALNVSFFREDIWLSISDEDYFVGGRWDEQRSSAVHDFWPKYGHNVPTEFAPDQAFFLPNSGQTEKFIRNSHSADLDVIISQDALTIVPIVYFPGWKAFESEVELPITPANDPSLNQLGQISFNLPASSHSIRLIFTDTPIRKLGNWLSLISLTITMGMILIKRPGKR